MCQGASGVRSFPALHAGWFLISHEGCGVRSQTLKVLKLSVVEGEILRVLLSVHTDWQHDEFQRKFQQENARVS